MSNGGHCGVFITGTDTGVGKTLIAAALIRLLAARGLRVAGMTPVASGAMSTDSGLRSEDALALMKEASVAAPYQDVNPYAFAPAIAPHLAAKEAGVRIEIDMLTAAYHRLAVRADFV